MLRYLRNKYHPLWRLRQLKSFRLIQEKFDPDITTKINGIKVSIKLIRDFSVLAFGLNSEEHSSHEFSNILKSQHFDLFFDIGANIGSYSWIALENDVSEIFLFEPDSTNQRLIFQTINKNALNNCFLFPLAVSKVTGVSEFLLDDASGTTGSLEDHTTNEASLHHAYGMHKKKFVPTINLDIFSEYATGKKTFVKIDVEGAEELVISGGSDFFTKLKPTILIECFSPNRLDFFKELNYSIEPLNEHGNYLLRPT